MPIVCGALPHHGSCPARGAARIQYQGCAALLPYLFVQLHQPALEVGLPPSGAAVRSAHQHHDSGTIQLSKPGEPGTRAVKILLINFRQGAEKIDYLRSRQAIVLWYEDPVQSG